MSHTEITEGIQLKLFLLQPWKQKLWKINQETSAIGWRVPVPILSEDSSTPRHPSADPSLRGRARLQALPQGIGLNQLCGYTKHSLSVKGGSQLRMESAILSLPTWGQGQG